MLVNIQLPYLSVCTTLGYQKCLTLTHFLVLLYNCTRYWSHHKK